LLNLGVLSGDGSAALGRKVPPSVGSVPGPHPAAPPGVKLIASHRFFSPQWQVTIANAPSRAFCHFRHHPKMGKQLRGSSNSTFVTLLALIGVSVLGTWYLSHQFSRVTTTDFEVVGENEAKVIARSGKVACIKINFLGSVTF
jgi:hypothetical protein